MLSNLLQNVFEVVVFGKGLVEVMGKVEGEELVLSVRDNGSGIKLED